jgi:hypothetical protein
MGITNNPTVYELYNKQIIFDNNITNALIKGLENKENKENMIHLMKITRDKHTYLNRIEQIFKFLKINLLQ